MERFKVIQDLGYGICLNSCRCEVFNQRQIINKDIHRGCLAKFQYREYDQNRSVLTLVTNNDEVYVRDFLCYNLIESKLFKYLNAINDFKERLHFYLNEEKREFVLYLEKNCVVSVGFPSGDQFQAVFCEINENEKKIFITVELLGRPLKYSLPANMVNKMAPFESRQKRNRGCLNCFKPTKRNNHYSILKYWRYNDTVPNRTTSNVTRGKSVSKSVEPVMEKLISQNRGDSGLQNNYHEPHKNVKLDKLYKRASNDEPRNDFTRKTVGQHGKRYENRRETRVHSALLIPSSLPIDLLTNSGVCYICSKLCEGNICRTCDNQPKNIFGQNNFQTNADSNIPAVTSLTIYTPKEQRVCPGCSNECDGNICRTCDSQPKNIFDQNNSKINVIADISAVTTLFNHEPLKSRVCPECLNEYEGEICQSCVNYTKHIFGQKNSQSNVVPNLLAITSFSNRICPECSNECDGNICHTCDNPSKNIFGQNNPKTKVVFNISAVTILPNQNLKNPRVCPKCLNVCDGNICRTCENGPKNIFGQNNSQNNVESNISSDTNLSNQKPIIPRVCSGCSNECEDNICRTCDNQPKNNFGQNNSQNNAYSNISSDTNLSNHKPMKPRICPGCSNECEDNICRTCDNHLRNIFGQDNSQTKIDSTKPFVTSLSPDILRNPELCDECSNVYKGNMCPICGTNKISGQNNSQNTVDSIISSDTSLSNQKPIRPRVCPERSNECEDNICRTCDNQPINNFGQNNSQNNVDSIISSDTSLSNQKPMKPKICPGCSNEYEDNICRTCDNQPKNIFGQNNSQNNVDSIKSSDTNLSNQKPIKPRVCPGCSNECEDNICRTCDNQPKNIFGQNNSQNNVDSIKSSDTSLSNQKPMKPKICPGCSNECEDNICRTCDNQPINIFGQNNFQNNVDSIISSDTSLSNQKPMKPRICPGCSNECEDNICRTCDSQPKNIFGQNNSQNNVGSIKSSDTNLSNQKPIKPRVCPGCSNECEDNICRTCDSQPKNIFGQNNSQNNVDSIISSDTSLSNQKPMKPRICPGCSNECEDNICRTCDNQPKNIFGQNNSQNNVDSIKSSDTSLSNHKPIKPRVCPGCSNDCEDNICRTCDNQPKNNFGQNNSQNNVDSIKSSDTNLSNQKPIKTRVCPGCSNECEDNICRTCDNQPINNFGQNNSQNNVDSIISSDTSLSNQKPIRPRVCPGCSNDCEDNICRTCDNQPKNNFGQNNSQNNVDSNISSDTNLSNQKPMKPRICSGCSNECENDTCRTCDSQLRNIFGQDNPQTKIDSNKSFVPSLSPDIPINPELCDECSNVYEGNICPSCGTNKISGQNNSQINVWSNISSDTSLSNGSPLTSIEINKHLTNEAGLPDCIKIAVRRNISASSCIICKNHLDKSEGFVLILCKHTFCETCIKKQINLEMLAHTNILPCCDRAIELDEVKYFLFNHEYEQFKASSKQQCFDKNCTGFLLWRECGEYEERPITFTCNKCKLNNCLKCEAIHVNLTCEQYEKITGEGNSIDKETAEMFLTWIREGIAMPCPKCEALIEKDEGCDWVQCPFCNVEICWATRGPRWGPEGKGDTSGGCGCDFKVNKCVDNCNYCH